MRSLACLSLILSSLFFLNGCTGCGQQKTPEQIREETANATAKLKSNSVAVAKGIKEGLSRPNTVDINTASKQELMTLPGVTGPAADHIISARPYDNPDQLVSRRIIGADEYDKIKDRVAVKK